MATVCIIPARGGSKRIPRKNVRTFCGRPIIAWSIDAALAAGCFDHVVVSTDDAEIAEVARRSGAEAPFVRPSALSDDWTGTNAVVAHAVNWFQGEQTALAAVCCLYPTAPFVRPHDLRRGLESLNSQDADFAVSVTTFPFPIQRAVVVDGDGYLKALQPDSILRRSQDLEEAYHDAGQFYWGTPTAFIDHESVFHGVRTAAVRVPRSRVQDIDTPEDWIRAEAMFRGLLSEVADDATPT